MKIKWTIAVDELGMLLMIPNIGTFFDGSGFKAEEAQLIDHAFAALEREEKRERQEAWDPEKYQP